jgi:hypothetical protein
MKSSALKIHITAVLISGLVAGCSPTIDATTTTSTPTATPEEFEAVIPISLPVAQDKRITFANAEKSFEEIPQTAWQNIQDVINANSAVDIPTTIVIGPNTDTTVEQITSLLQMQYRLWNGFEQPPSFAGLVYNAQDEAWAEQEWPKMAAELKLTDNPEWEISALRAGCNFTNDVATECYGGS